MHGREGLDGFEPGGGIQKSGDALRGHHRERCLGGLALLLRRWGWYQRAEHLVGGVFQQPRGFAVGVTPDLAAQRVFGVAGDPAQGERPRIRQHGVAERGADDDRSRGAERIQICAAGAHPRWQHVFLEPGHHQQPGIRPLGLGCIETGFHALLQLRHGQRRIFEVAFEQGSARLEGVHMRIDQPGHDEAPGEVLLPRACSDKGPNFRFAAGVNDAPRRYGQCLHLPGAGVCGEDHGIAVDRVGGRRGLARAGAAQQGCGKNSCESHGRFPCGGQGGAPPTITSVTRSVQLAPGSVTRLTQRCLSKGLWAMAVRLAKV